jgi:carbon monoxide dehydrogenase subunit G
VTHVERSIEVEVPVRTAYDQWTQFEEFPRFMSGVQEVMQVGDALTHWVAEIAGVRREWDAAILEQLPDEKVAWAATSGATNAGAVYFTAVGADRTRVRLTLDYEPEGLVERIGDVFDVIDRQAVADLDRFKEFIEQAGSASGGWRGTVEDGDVQSGAAATAGSSGTTGRAAGGATAAGSTEVPSGAAGVEADLVAVGPTGDTHGSVATEAGPARTPATDRRDDTGVGHSGDPVAVDPPSSGGTESPAADGASPTGSVTTGMGGARGAADPERPTV